MNPSRHYPHICVRIKPDPLRAALLLFAYAMICVFAWQYSIPELERTILIIFLALLGLLKAADAMQLTGPWSVREIVLSGSGRWTLIDPQRRTLKAKLVYLRRLSQDLMILHFRDMKYRYRTVILTASNCDEERRRRLACRLFYGTKMQVQNQ